MANEFIPDGSTDFSGGQDASKVPHKIAPNAYQYGVNLDVRKGSVKPRSGLTKHKLGFIDASINVNRQGYTRTVKSIFESGNFQAQISYSVGSQFYQIVVIAGVIYLINQDTLALAVIDIEDGSRLNPVAPRLNWSVAGSYLVIFDYPAYPVIIEGVSARRADPAKDEIPVSVMGTYNQNRLFIANAGNEFTAGDPAGSLAAPDAPITFLEVLQPAAPYLGQIFQLSTNYSNDTITAMTFLQVTDTSTGIGPLLIATQNSIWSYQTQQPRDTWEAGQFGSVFVNNAGIVGPRAFVNVNSDLFFLSNDGQVRSASMSRDEQKKWARIPMSREVENWLKYWDKELAKFAVLGYFNNKIYISANPYRVKATSIVGREMDDYVSGGFVSLSLDNISTLGQEGQPSWDGLFTGLRPMDIQVNNDRCFVMAKDSDGINSLYEIVPGQTYDTDGEHIRYIDSKIYTREYEFGDGFMNKDIHSIDLEISEVKGDLEVDVKYKPSQSSEYLDWKIFRHKAPWRDCKAIPTCPMGLESHSFREITLGSPDNANDCDPVSNILYRVFRRLQLKFNIKGINWELQGFKIKAIVKAQNEQQLTCDEAPVVKLCKACDTDWNIEEFSAWRHQIT